MAPPGQAANGLMIYIHSTVEIVLGSLQRNYRWGPLLTKEYPIKHSLQWFFPKPPHGGLAIFSSGTYAIIGTTGVKSETCYEKNHEKKHFFI